MSFLVFLVIKVELFIIYEILVECNVYAKEPKTKQNYNNDSNNGFFFGRITNKKPQDDDESKSKINNRNTSLFQKIIKKTIFNSLEK